MQFPRMLRLRQKFDSPQVANVAAEVARQLESLALRDRVQPGDSVALTAGSRGIANIAVILQSIAAYFKTLGAKPFIVPAMGSHGGGTVAGQLELLQSYQITEEFVGAPIRATMETVVVAETSQGVPVHFDRFAAEADHVFVCNRIKPHTGFVGEIESGLHKMLLIGLGKHVGAKIYHSAIVNFSFAEIIQSVAQVVLQKCGVIGGLAIVENALDETALLEAVPPDAFYEREVELLKRARQWMPQLPFADIDLLIVDEMGKNISGTGLDTNVIGRKFNNNKAMDGDLARVRRIVVRGLTPETHGNASGIGMADFTTQRCIDSIDLKKTRINCITANHPAAGKLPISLEHDREAVEVALQTIGMTPPAEARVVHITNTLHMAETLVSEAFLSEIANRPDLEALEDASPMKFDGNWLRAVHDSAH